jgi:RNA polymerase primary sigma factor
MPAGTPRGSDQEAVAPYLDTIRRHPPLSREEEHALAVRARAGDVEAKKRLARHNLAFVVAVARRMRRSGVPLDDLVQEGNVGLMRAIEKFDPGAGTRFSTYAVWWIRAYVGKHLKEARSAVRPRAGAVARPDVSLDAAADCDGETTHLDRIEDGTPGPEDRYLSKEGDEGVRAAISSVRKGIGDLGWDIVHARLEQDEPTSLEEIGRRWGLSRERVRQAEIRTRRVLQRVLATGREREAA